MTREPPMFGVEAEAVFEKLRAEIKRLKAENRQLENEIADMALGPTMVQNQRAEIEQLKAEYPYSELDMEMHVEAVTKELRAEIERLKALSQNNAHSWDAVIKERDELRAKIERLTVENNELRKGQIIRLTHAKEAAAEIERLRAALTGAETVMMIVEPRSHKTEYLAALAAIRAALKDPKP